MTGQGSGSSTERKQQKKKGGGGKQFLQVELHEKQGQGGTTAKARKAAELPPFEPLANRFAQKTYHQGELRLPSRLPW